MFSLNKLISVPIIIRVSFALLFSFSLVSSALAQAVDSAPSSNDSEWSYRLSPYAWATALSGKSGVNGKDANLNMDIRDVIDHTDGALMLNFEVKYDRVGIITDLIYANLSDSTATPRELLFDTAKVEVYQLAWTETVSYALVREKQLTLDLLAGMRLMGINEDLKLKGGLAPEQKFSEDQTWVDPLIGARAQFRLTENMFFRVMGDIGGFNACSTLTWQALGVFGYEITPSSVIGAGYRAMGYDHSVDGFTYDLIMYGPLIGAEFKF